MSISHFSSRVSPIEWDNVVLYGQYVLDRRESGAGERSTCV